MIKYPFIKCLSPQRIKNQSTGEYMYVGCGKCASCRNLRASQLTLKCNLESKAHKYCHFITLTYDETFVPICSPIALSGTKGQQYAFISLCKRTKEVGNILAISPFRERLIDELYKKLGTTHGIPYLSRRDAQLFIKRLRKNLNSKGYGNIRFFICGEYGPQHLRPHFHLLVWHSNRQASEGMAECVRESWKFGTSDIQLVQTNASTYVASYVNSLGSLPDLYKQGQFKPFSSHSLFLGEKFYRSQGKETYKLTATEFIRRSERLNDSVSEFSLWRSLKDTFYPKCRGFATLSPGGREFLYTIYAKFRDRQKTHRQPYKLASEIIDEMQNIFYSWDLPADDLAFVAMYYDKMFRWSITHAQYVNSQELFLKGFLTESEYLKQTSEYIEQRQRIHGVIYRDLKTSKHFLEFICNSSDPLEISSQVHMIEHFYNALELSTLKDFYESQSQMLEDGSIEFDELEFFYDDMSIDNFMDSNIYKSYKKEVLKLIDDKVKHKRQNDANRLHFCQVGLI